MTPREHRHAGWDESRGTLSLGKGLELPKAFNVVFGDPDLPCRVRLDLAIEGGRLEVAQLTCTRRKGEPLLTTEQLRRVPVARLIREAAEYVLFERGGKQWARTRNVLDDVDFDALVENGPQPETLEYVAAIYRLAWVCHDDPTKAVVERFGGLPRSTAGRWVSKAREAGYLGPAADRRAGEH